MKHVDQERLERWLIRKTTQDKRKAIQPVKTATSSGMKMKLVERFRNTLFGSGEMLMVFTSANFAGQGQPSLSKWKVKNDLYRIAGWNCEEL